MTTKDFSKMTTRKLNAVVNSAESSAEDIQAAKIELEKRAEAKAAAEAAEESQQASQPVVVECGEADTLSPEEAAAIEAAEAEYKKEQKEGRKTLLALSPEEIEARKAEMAEKIACKCKVMPNGEVEWFDGVITTIMHDKRSNAIMYVVRLEDGKKVRKAYGAKSLVISDEKVELTAKHASSKSRDVSSTARRTLDEAESLREEAKSHIGQYATIGDFKGYVSGIMLDKRSNQVLFNFKTTDNSAHKYKSVTSDKIVWLDEFNEEFIARRNKEVAIKDTKTPVEALADVEAKIAKLKESIAKATASLEKLQAMLPDMQAAAANYVAPTEATAEATAEDDVLA